VLKENQETTAAELLAFLKDKLAKYKMPKYIEFTAALPKTASEKIKKFLLKNNSK
jgi:benzoate-CoA ligase